MTTSSRKISEIQVVARINSPNVMIQEQNCLSLRSPEAPNTGRTKARVQRFAEIASRTTDLIRVLVEDQLKSSSRKLNRQNSQVEVLIIRTIMALAFLLDLTLKKPTEVQVMVIRSGRLKIRRLKESSRTEFIQIRSMIGPRKVS